MREHPMTKTRNLNQETTMAKAVRYHKQGGPEVMQYEDVTVGEPAQGQVRIKHTAIGVNFVDTYQRSGLYPMQLPQVAGNEGAGVVDAVGAGVTEVKAGDHVTYTGLPGSYCETRLVPADRVVKLPQGISDEQAASMLLKGLTVHYLIFSTFKVNKGDAVLWHAAAGGVGLIACQWLKALGVTTIATDGSLDCLRPRGLMVTFGNASGAVPPVNLGILSTKGSLFVTRPTLATHIASRSDLVERSKALFDIVASG